jgi:hypothetical protein
VTHYITFVILLKYWRAPGGPQARAGRAGYVTRQPRGGAVMSKRRGKAALRGWLAMFIVLPLSVWLAAALRSGFHEKSLSNLSLEPLIVLLFSVAVFVMWFLVARRGLRPTVGIILLIIVLAAALAVHRFLPHLRE